MYYIQKNLNKLNYGQPTFFLNPAELRQVASHIKKKEYHIFYPYPDSEKNIIYQGKVPEVLLYEIIVKENVRHQDILGSLYSLNIDDGLFGDIVINDGRYFIFILPIVRNYFESNFLMIKNSRINLKELDSDYLKDFQRKFLELELIVSSVRIDTVVSSICHIGRNKVSDMMKKKEIMLNYDFLKDLSYSLKDNDTFSIKRIGKFKYGGVLKKTKSNHAVIMIYQYL